MRRPGAPGPAAARARADRPNTTISTRSLLVSVSRDADFGATSFDQREGSLHRCFVLRLRSHAIAA